MSLSYKTKHCTYCKKVTPWEPKLGQVILLSFLTCMGGIPGLIYYYVAEPKCCKQCGFEEADAEFLEQQNK